MFFGLTVGDEVYHIPHHIVGVGCGAGSIRVPMVWLPKVPQSYKAYMSFEL